MFEDQGRPIIDLSAVRPGRAVPNAREAAQLEFTNLVLSERLTELELELENNWWVRLVDRADREFSRSGLRQIGRVARMIYLKNPLINRAVEVQAHYVFGQGMSVKGRHELVDAVIQDFMDDRGNQKALTSHQARIGSEKQLEVDGNFFVAVFTNPQTGHVRVRTIPFDQIEDIICNPEDQQEPWYYKRSWEQQVFDPDDGKYKPQHQTAYYPDIDYQPKARWSHIGGDPVVWDSPVKHVKVGGTLDMRFGVPEYYAAIDWALAYKTMLENDATRSAALSRFAWSLTMKNSSSGKIAAAKSKLSTTVGADNGMAIETNPPPTTGSTWISSDMNELKPMNLAGASFDPDHSRPHKLMVAAAVGLPETFFGDSDVGNHATAKTLDRPTELKMLNRRQLWAAFWQELLQYVVDQAIKAPSGLLPDEATQSVRDAFGNQQLVAIDPQTHEEIDRYIEVSFPDLLEHDVDARVAAIVNAATLQGWAPAGTMPPETLSELLLSALGLDDIDEILEDLNQDAGEQDPEAEPEPQEAQPRESLVAAVRGLREAVVSMMEAQP